MIERKMQVCVRNDGAVFPYSKARAAKEKFRVEVRTVAPRVTPIASSSQMPIKTRVEEVTVIEEIPGQVEAPSVVEEGADAVEPEVIEAEPEAVLEPDDELLDLSTVKSWAVLGKEDMRKYAKQLYGVEFLPDMKRPEMIERIKELKAAKESEGNG